MANESQGNAPVDSVRETLDRAISDVNRILGLQGLPAGNDAAVPMAGGSTISVTCSTYSYGCGGTTLR
ncbi:hypothetical protein ACIQ6Y_33585 [Streptomyces sp. NPDC096205]|uniref:hypothetical protein n=1 Tax=Streptomyces sp. NPDC096205 TaxID=3366081 RepID=UPI003802D259